MPLFNNHRSRTRLRKSRELLLHRRHARWLTFQALETRLLLSASSAGIEIDAFIEPQIPSQTADGEGETNEDLQTQNPWHNYADPYDVSGDGQSVPLDILMVINELNFGRYHDQVGRLQMPPPENAPPPYFDVNDDQFVTPNDALNAINNLNAPVELTLSRSSGRPGNTLVVSTSKPLDQNALTHVVFTDSEGNESRAVVLSSKISENAVEVAIPVGIDPITLEAGIAVEVSVTLTQEGTSLVFDTVPDFQIDALPPTGLPVGIVAIDVLNLVRSNVDTAISDWHQVSVGSDGTVDTSELRGYLSDIWTNATAARDKILELVTGKQSSIEFGQIDGQQIFLDLESLELLDQFLFAFLLGNKQPAQSGSGEAEDGTGVLCEDSRTCYYDEFNLSPDQQIDEVFGKIDNIGTVVGGTLAFGGLAATLLVGGAPLIGVVGSTLAAVSLFTPGLLGVITTGVAIPLLGSDVVPGTSEAVVRNTVDGQAKNLFMLGVNKLAKIPLQNTLSAGNPNLLSDQVKELVEEHLGTATDISKLVILGAEQLITGLNAKRPQIVANLDAKIAAIRDATGANTIEARAAISQALKKNANGQFVLNEAIAEAQAILATSPGVTVRPATGIETSESGKTGAFEIVLNKQPAADVKIQVSTSDDTEGTVKPSSATFTNFNWQEPRIFLVEPVDDSEVDGDIEYSIVTHPAQSSDIVYNGQNGPDVGVKNLDDDIPVDVIVETMDDTTSEDGDRAKFRVKLSALPTAEVSIWLSVSDNDRDEKEGLLDKINVRFSVSNWDQFQEVTVIGQNDNEVDGDVEYTISGVALSDDPRFDLRHIPDVELVNKDNDVNPESPFVRIDSASCSGVPWEDMVYTVTGTMAGPVGTELNFEMLDWTFFASDTTSDWTEQAGVSDSQASLIRNADDPELAHWTYVGHAYAPAGGNYATDIRARLLGFNWQRSDGKSIFCSEALQAESAIEPDANTDGLSQNQLEQMRDAILQHWVEIALDDETIGVLAQAKLEVADLSGTLLGLAGSNVIYIDHDAAGFGWFVDATPFNDDEFDGSCGSGLLASGENEAVGRMDLLTALLHEVGHLLGQSDLDPHDHPGDLMASTLAPGVRRCGTTAVSGRHESAY